MRAFFLGLALVLAACGDRPSEPTGTPPSESISAATEAAPVDPTDGTSASRGAAADSATISVEGTDERIAVRSVRFEDVPLPFETVIPADWAYDVLGSGEGTAVRVTTDEPPARGAVVVFVPSEPNRDGIAELARAVAESRGDAREVDAIELWTDHVFLFGGPDASGSVRVGEHAGVPFYVLAEAPVEMADRFAPRAGLVVSRLRWLDDGTGLAGE